MMPHPGLIAGFIILAIGVAAVAWLNVRAIIQKRRQIDAEPAWDGADEP